MRVRTCREGPVSVPSIRRRPGTEEKPEVGRVGHRGENQVIENAVWLACPTFWYWRRGRLIVHKRAAKGPLQ